MTIAGAATGERIPFARTQLCDDAVDAVNKVLTSGWLTTGPQVAAFEGEFSHWVGAEHAVAVSSCTAGLELSLRSLYLPPGAPVLVPTITFCGAVNAILHAGLRPVLVDADPDTLMPDAQATARAAAHVESPAAMVALHFAGHPAAVEEVAGAAGLTVDRVVEDAAHAVGTVAGGRMVGALSAATCFSFYATKNLAIGEGGMVTTDVADVANYLRRGRLHGISRDAWQRSTPGSAWRYSVDDAGLKANMTDMQAAIGRAQLRHLDEYQARRAAIAARYDSALADVHGLRLPARPSHGGHAWHLYVVQVLPEFGASRDELIADLDERGIECSVHFIPNHQQPYLRRLLGDETDPRRFPGAEAASRRNVSLPLYPALRDEEVDRVCEAIADLARRTSTLGRSAKKNPRTTAANGVAPARTKGGSTAVINKTADRGTPLPEPSHVSVVGGAGFLGSILVELLLDEGYQVTILDALLYGDEGIRHLIDRPRLSLVPGDLRDITATVRAFRHADAVVHLGALVGDPACDIDARLTLEINRDATAKAAAIARGLGIDRFVFASTCSVYGASGDALDEDSPLHPISVYARSKVESEQLLLAQSGEGFWPTVLRLGTLYGRSPRERFDLVVNLLTAQAVATGEITVFGGSQWRPFVHVRDAADAILRCLQAPCSAAGGRVFNVGADHQNHTLAEVAEIICSAVPDAKVRLLPAATEEAGYRVCFARIRSALGFVSRRTLADGVAEIAASISCGAVPDYTDARYSNYKALMSGEAMAALAGSALPTAASAAG